MKIDQSQVSKFSLSKGDKILLITVFLLIHFFLIRHKVIYLYNKTTFVYQLQSALWFIIIFIFGSDITYTVGFTSLYYDAIFGNFDENGV